MKKHISHVHVHDNLGDKDSHMALGQGNISLSRTLMPFLLNEDEPTFTIECGNKEAVLTSWEMLRELKSCFF